MPITSTNPGGAIPPDYRKQRLTLSSLVIGEVISGVFTTASIPGTTFSYTIASTDITTATAALKAAIEAHAAEEVASGSAWASVTVGTASTYIDVFSLDADGDLVFTSTPPGGGSSVVTKLWIGDAVAVAQVVSVVPLNVQIGDVFALTINAKSISVTATAATAANVVALFVAAIDATAIPEWQEVTAAASSDGGTLTLTANTAGVPFTVTAGSTDAVGIEITTTTPGVDGTNATQQFSIPLSAAGTFEITFGDQKTTAIAVGASSTTVQSALEALSTIGSGNATVTAGTSGDGNDTVYTVTFGGTLAKIPVAELIVDLISTKPLIRTTQQGSTSGTVRNEIQTIEVGQGRSFTLTLDGQTTSTITTTSYAADDSGLFSGPISSLTNIEAVSVTKLPPTAQNARFGTSTYQIEFHDYDGSAQQSQITASTYSASNTQTHRLAITNTAGVVAGNEVQKIAIQGTASGGTFTLTYAGQTTSAIAYNASAATVDAALAALSNIGSGDVSVTGQSGGPWFVEFTGTLAGGDRSQITASSSLTGSSASNLTIVTTTASSGPNDFGTAGNWSPSGVPADGDALRFEVGSSDCLYSLDQTGKTFPSVRFDLRWTGKLGLPRLNTGGYLEYRTRELTAGMTVVEVGTGNGSGPQKVAINTLTVQTSIRVRDSGASSEINVPCVIWRGSNVANVVEVNGGEFGSAWYSDETASMSRLDQTGGEVFLKNTTIVDAVDVQGGTFRSYGSTLGGKPLNV